WLPKKTRLACKAIYQQGGTFCQHWHSAGICRFAFGMGVISTADADAVEAGDDPRNIRDITGAAVARIEGFDCAESQIAAYLIELFQKHIVSLDRRHRASSV